MTTMASKGAAKPKRRFIDYPRASRTGVRR